MPRKTYAKAEIEAALAVIDSTRGRNGQPNFSRAARDTGIKRQTLLGWDTDRKRTDNVQPNAPDKTVIAQLEAKLRGDLTEHANTVRFALLDQMLEVVPHESNLTALTNALARVGAEIHLE
jgi:hypothetical protein